MASGAPAPSTIVVSSLVATTRRASPRSSTVTESSLRPISSLMTVPPVRMAMSRSISLRRSPKPGALTARTWMVPRSLFTTRVGEGLAVDVLGDDEERAADLDGLLERRQHVRNGRDLLVGDQDLGVVQDRFHAIRVGHEVGRDVASVELHALGVFLLETERLAFLDRDDAVLADLVHDLGDDVADFRIRGGDGGDGRDLLARVDRAGLLLDLGDDGLDGLLDADADEHRVGARGDVADAFVDHRLAQDHGGGGAVAGDVVGLGRDFLEKLGAHVLERVFQFDVAGDGHAVVGDRRRAELLVQDDVATLGPDRDLDGLGQAVHAALEGSTSGLVEYELLSQVCLSSALLGRTGSARGRCHLDAELGFRRPAPARQLRDDGAPAVASHRYISTMARHRWRLLATSRRWRGCPSG